jgi:hypothetical protein
LSFKRVQESKNPDFEFEEKYQEIFIGNQKEWDKTKPDY